MLESDVVGLTLGEGGGVGVTAKTVLVTRGANAGVGGGGYAGWTGK